MKIVELIADIFIIVLMLNVLISAVVEVCRDMRRRG